MHNIMKFQCQHCGNIEDKETITQDRHCTVCGHWDKWQAIPDDDEIICIERL